MRWLIAGLMWLLACSAVAAGPHALWSLDAPLRADSNKALHPGIYAIQFDPQGLAEWPVGEFGELILPGGRSYQIKADRIEEHDGGNRTWIGKFDVNGYSYVSVLTYGPAGLVGEVRTPDGLMVLTTQGSQVTLVDTTAAGWVLPPVVGSDARRPPPLETNLVAPPTEAVTAKALDVQTTIDLMIAYTDGFVANAGSVSLALLSLNNLVATSNQAYIDSQIAITLRLVYAVQVAYTDSNNNDDALNALTDATDAALVAANGTLRNRYGADIVALVRPFTYPDQVSCGVAWLNGGGGNGAAIAGAASHGYAVISNGSVTIGPGQTVFCPAGTFPHELGHNMGAAHDLGTVTQGTNLPPVPPDGAFPYSYGYVASAAFNGGLGQNVCNVAGDPACFGTIMSYITTNGALRFSNPLQSNCGAGAAACGLALADNTQTLNTTKPGVASWRGTLLPFTGVLAGTGQTAATNTQFAQTLKVTVKDQTNAVAPGVTVNFAAPASGASAALSATSQVTDVNGIAQVTATANGTAGSYNVVATANPGFVTSTFNFNLTNGAPSLSVTIGGTGTGSVAGGGISCPGTCTISPPPGTGVALTATATGGSVFTGWLGSGCTGVSTCNVTVDAAKSVNATFAPTGTVPNLDADLCSASTKYDALTDGLLIVRYLSGLTGTALTTSAIGTGGTCRSSATVKTYLDNIAPRLDVDGNGTVDALTDGMMIVRYLFGLRGTAVTQGVIGTGATQTSAQIVTNIAALLP